MAATNYKAICAMARTMAREGNYPELTFGLEELAATIESLVEEREQIAVIISRVCRRPTMMGEGDIEDCLRIGKIVGAISIGEVQ